MNEKIHQVTVLLVDDEVDFLDAISKVLSRRGLNVLTAAQGQDALDQLAVTPVDVVVLDVKMPGMDGDEVFSRIQNEWSDLPVIMLTGHGSVSHAFQMSKDGVFDYLAKPCDIDALFTMIRQAAGGRQEQPVEEKIHGNQFNETISVLLVDDNEVFLQSLSRILERRGMSITTATNGVTALQRLRKSMIDVVVLDVRMPGLSGLDTLQHIRLEFPDIEVILLTGHPDISSAVCGMRLGAIEYLPKPPNTEELIARIREAAQIVHEHKERRRRNVTQEILTQRPY